MAGKPVLAFWDASAIVPLCCPQAQSPKARHIARTYGDLVVWWCTEIEVLSAFNRLKREGALTQKEISQALSRLNGLSAHWDEIFPNEQIRDTASRLLGLYPLRAADALQLSAAIVWAGLRPKGRVFVCGDGLLSRAAEGEGFTVVTIK